MLGGLSLDGAAGPVRSGDEQTLVRNERLALRSDGHYVRLAQTVTVMSESPHHHHILVVDDDASIRNLLTEYFTENEFRVSTAESRARV